MPNWPSRVNGSRPPVPQMPGTHRGAATAASTVWTTTISESMVRAAPPLGQGEHDDGRRPTSGRRRSASSRRLLLASQTSPTPAAGQTRPTSRADDEMRPSKLASDVGGQPERCPRSATGTREPVQFSVPTEVSIVILGCVCSGIDELERWSHEPAALLSTRCGRSVRIAGIRRLPPAGGAGRSASAAYAVHITEQNFQEVLEASRSAPVLLSFESPGRSPESVQLPTRCRRCRPSSRAASCSVASTSTCPADRPGDADPVGPARRAGRPGAADAAAPEPRPARGAAPGASPRCSSS